MVRKQLYITEAHEVAVKARANELGMTEARVLRNALDQAFGYGRPPMSPTQRDAFEQFLESAEHVRGALPPHGHRVYDRMRGIQRRFTYITQEW